jgi:putative ABC transport system permease protein
MFRSLVRLQHVDLGFTAPPADVLAVQIDPTHLPRERQYQFYQELLQRLQSLSGVQSAALSLNIPPNRARYLDNFTIPGVTEATPNVPFSLCGPNVFKTLGIPLLEGRDFTEDDKHGGHPVVIISDSLAKQYFRDSNPIGRTFKQGDSTEPENPYMEVVGVVGDVRFNGVREANTMAYYGPYTQEAVPYWKYLLVRTSNPLSLVPTIRSVVRQIDNRVSIGHPETMGQVIALDLEESRIQTFILLLFAILAILLAAIGIYGLMLYTVVQERKEIALRIAIGAQRWHVVFLVTQRAFLLTCGGILAGVPVALLATRLLRTFLFGITANDPETFALMGAVVMSMAMAATIIPVWKAVRTHPVSVLKSE